MFIFTSKEQLTSAIERAKTAKSKIRIRFIAVGRYQVQSTSDPDKWYDASCGRMENGDKFVSCGCPWGDLRGKECKHAPALIGFHIAVMTARKNAAKQIAA